MTITSARTKDTRTTRVTFHEQPREHRGTPIVLTVDPKREAALAHRVGKAEAERLIRIARATLTDEHALVGVTLASGDHLAIFTVAELP